MRVAPQLTLALLLALVPSAASKPQGPDDPPSRVVRLSFMGGAVSFRRADADDWSDATLNYPLTTGDELWTDADSRAEVTLGSAAIRLAPFTSFTFLALDDQVTQIRLAQGTVYVRLRRLARDESFEIDTPGGAVTLMRAGAYRVDVDQNGETTTATVRDGQAEVLSAGSSFSVQRGQAATVVGIDQPTYDVRDAAAPDAWEGWSVARDRRYEGARSARYVSEDMPGYEDLDEHGDWRDTPEYGAVWTPRVAAGWAPYRDGHWAWVDPWGWTWIDDAPWGFAPFHYGRWVYVGDGWAWVPGRVMARPVYAPALVVFVGGANWDVAVGGGFGWFPLGPNEVYVPAYRVSEGYARRVNETTVNVTTINVTTIDVTHVRYRNRDVAGGLTVVTRETFVGARPVRPGMVVVSRDRLGSAGVLGMGAPLAPTRQSLLARPEAGAASRPPDAATRRVVVVQHTPPPPPVPFSAKEQALNAHPGQPLDRTALSTLRRRTPDGDTNRLVRPGAPAGGQPQLRPGRAGLPASQPALPPGVTRQPTVPSAQPVQPALPPGVTRQPTVPSAQPVQPALPPGVSRQPTVPPAQPAQPTQPDQGSRQPPPPVERPQPRRPPARVRSDSAERPRPAQPAPQPVRPEGGARQQPPSPAERPQPGQPPARVRGDSVARPRPAQPEPQPPQPARPDAGPRRQPGPPSERPQPDRPSAKARGDTAERRQPARTPARGRQEKDSSETKNP